MSLQKPMNTSSIVQLYSNETIPEALLQKLAAENQSAFGLVVREPDKIVVEKFHKLDGLEKNVVFFTQLNESTKKYARMFIFQDLATEFDEDEVQPWTVIKDSKGNPLLVVAIEGDFPKHIDNEFSESYKLMHDWLGPKIEAMYKTLGNSMQKLTDYLKSEQFKNDFEQTIGHRAALGFMPSVGNPWVLEQNDIGVTGTWGSASNAYGYTESALEAATVEKPAETAKPLKSKYASDAPIKVEPKPVTVPPKVEPAPAKDPIEKVVEDLGPEEIEWRVPKGVHGKARKAAIRAVCNGDLPTNWRDENFMVMVKTKRSVKSFKEMPALEAKKPADVKDSVLTMPIISGKTQEKAVDYIKKHVGDGSAVIVDPIEAQKAEGKLAKFSELVLKSGKLDEIDRFTTEFIMGFDREILGLLAIELRRERQKMVKLLTKAGITLADLVGTETEEKPEIPAKPDVAPIEEPVKKSKYA